MGLQGILFYFIAALFYFTCAAGFTAVVHLQNVQNVIQPVRNYSYTFSYTCSVQHPAHLRI